MTDARIDQQMLTRVALGAVAAARSSPSAALRPGTVQSSSPGIVLVTLDGDSVAVPCQPLTPTPEAGDRVMVQLQPPSGAFVIGFIGESRERWGTGGGGGPSGDLGVTFVQATPATVWTIDHSLTFVPNVTVVDSAGTQVEGEVELATGNQVVIRFSAAFAGTAYLS